MQVLVSGRLRSLGGFAALEFVGELLDASSGVNEALLAGEGGMRVHRDVAQDDIIFLAIDLLLAGRFHGGLGEETLAARNIEEANIIKSRMAFGFHGENIGLVAQPWRAL